MKRNLTTLLLLLLAASASALERNVASQKVAVFAYDTGGSGRPGKTGDAAQITAYISQDGGASYQSNDTNPTELDATNQPGLYLFDLQTSETNGLLVCISAVSSTADIEIQPLTIYTVETMRGTDSAALASALATAQADIDAIETTVTAILADTVDIQSRLPAALVGGRIDANVGAIETLDPTDTLTSSANAALVAQKLDHLVAVADADDVADNAIIAKLADNTYATANWSDFDNTVHSLTALRERGDQAWKTGSGSGATESYTSVVWARTIGDNDGGTRAYRNE